MEIVGEPDLRSPEEARDYLVALRQILRYAGVSTANMEEGAFRCDANISVRRVGEPLGAKVEVKKHELVPRCGTGAAIRSRRQLELLRVGERIEQETRGWVEDRGITVSQRTKEQAHDFGTSLSPICHRCSSLRRWWTGCGRACQSFPPRGGSGSCKSSR